MQTKWFAPNLGYSMAKFGMSLVTLGLAGELAPKSIAVNALWPRTTIATAAISNNFGEAIMNKCRTPEILADAAHVILTKPSGEFTGQFCIDDNLLSENGVTNFDKYRVDKTEDLMPDFFVPDDIPAPEDLSALSD